MSRQNQPDWSQVIRHQVFILITLLLILGTMTAGYYAWIKHTSSENMTRANEYHLASNTHFLKAKEELRHIQIQLVHDLMSENDNKNISEAVDSIYEYNSNASHYLVKQEINNGIKLHEDFGSDKFQSLITHLKKQLDDFEKYNNSFTLQNISTTQEVPNVRNLVTTLDKLLRLHTIVRYNLMITIAEDKKNQAIHFGLLILLFILIGFIFIKRTLSTIATVLKELEKTGNALADSENKYRTLFDKTADAILIIENDKFINCNQATVKMLGYNSKDELLSTHPSELSPQTQPDGKSSFDKANKAMSIAHDRGSYRFEWQHKRKNGESFPVEVLLTSIPYKSKAFLHVVWRDITKRKLTDKALQRAQKMDAIGQLSGGIAHDFNNILSVILGNLQLLQQQVKTDSKAVKRIETIQNSANRAAELTNKLLSFSRVTPDKITSSNINDTLEKMQNLIAQALTPQINIEMHLKTNLWNTYLDTGELGDALLNLAINARDAMQGKGNLIIETKNTTLDESYCKINPGVIPGDYVEMSVTDTGCGIAEELQDRVFEPFFTTKEIGKGTGLGLSMVFGFIKRSGGSIKVYSESNIGTTFRLYLPRDIGNKEPVSITRTPTEPSPAGDATILAVDDEPDILLLVEEALTSNGYKVLTASNAKQALTILAANSDIDMLFSDVVMPGEHNGFELAERAKALYPQLKILLTSGYTEKALAHNGQARFKSTMLSKPYTIFELIAHIQQILSHTVQESNK